MKEWWASSVQKTLSQGDIVNDLFVGRMVVPRVRLLKESGKHGREQWVPSPAWKTDKDGHARVLARGRFGPAIVVSHSCDLDKALEEDDPDSLKREPVLVAPVRPAGKLPAEDRERILSHGDHHAMGLCDLPELGDSYADFRHIAVIERGEIEACHRIASMTELGTKHLQARLLVFFLRADPAFWLNAETAGGA